MTDSQTALLRLMAWLSPAFPVGSFSYSHGLETAAHRGLVGDAAGLRGWLADLIERGSAWNDAVLFAEAHRLIKGPETGAAVEGTQDPLWPAGHLPLKGEIGCA